MVQLGNSLKGVGLLAVGLSLASAAASPALNAQVPAITAANHERAVPQVRIYGVNSVMALAQWPGISMKVNEESHVVMFAVTRGRQDVPIQVLSPRRPGLDTRIRSGRSILARELGRRELFHLVNFGEAPLVVAFASRSKPNLDQFRFGPQWADDLLLDTLVTSQEEMLDVLGKSVFGPDAEFSVAVATAPDPIPVSQFAESWYFDNACSGRSSYYRRIATLGWFGGTIFSDYDAVRDAFGFSLYGWSPFSFGLGGMGLGVPAMFYGSMFSLVGPYLRDNPRCGDYRIAWWPGLLPRPRPGTPADTTPVDSAQTPKPPTPATRLGTDDFGGTGSSAPSPAFEPSAWRRGETGSERRFPSVVADERPWNKTRALPGSTTVDAAGDAALREARRRDEERRYERSGWNRNRAITENGNRAQSAGNSSDGSSARGASPTRGREFPTGNPARSGPAVAPKAEAPRPAPAPRSDGSIIPVSPPDQRGTGTP